MSFISVRFEPVEDGIHSTLLNGDVYVYTTDEENHTNRFIEPRAFDQSCRQSDNPYKTKRIWMSQLRRIFRCDNITISLALQEALWQKARYSPKNQEQKEAVLLMPTQAEIMDMEREGWAFVY